MNGIAHNMVPSDEQLHCQHLVVIEFPDEMGYIVARPDDVESLKGDHGIAHRWCSKCGARLIEREGQRRKAE